MRYEEFYCKGHKGYFAKLGLEEIYIDFRKCVNDLITIKAPNGYGKSSLISILHMFPDSISDIREDISGEKWGIVVHAMDRYKFKIIYPLNTKGKREATKAYLFKEVNGSMVNLNPNGNITSYKEILEIEFNLDPSFLLLSFLSITNKGIVDRRPSDRKKYINPLIKDINIYNGFLKTLNKRRSALKSLSNNIISKMSLMGDENEIELSLASITNRISTLMNEKDKKLQELSESKSKIKLLDPNGSIQESYKSIYESLVKINKDIDILSNDIEKYQTKLPNINKDNIKEIFNSNKNTLEICKGTITTLELDIDKMMKERENEANRLADKSARLDSLKMDIAENNISEEIIDCNDKLAEYKSIIDKMNIKDINKISKEEFIIGVNALKEIKDTILILKQNIPEHIIESSINFIQSNKLDINFEDTINEINQMNIEKAKISIEIERYNSLLKETEKLSLRDKKCNIDSCMFIKSALEAQTQEPKKNLDRLEKRLQDIESTINILNTRMDNDKELMNGVKYLRDISKYLSTNISILKKLPVDMKIFGNEDYIFKAIESGNNFNDIDYLYGFIQFADVIDLYKIQLNRKSLLDKDYQIYIERNKVIDEIINEITSINKRIDDTSSKITEMMNEIQSNKERINKINSDNIIIEKLIEMYNTLDNLNIQKSNIISQYNLIKANMASIKECIDIINQYQSDIKNIESDIAPLMIDRDKLNHSLSMTKEYKKELEIFQAQMLKIETLRKYCNPNDEGIQLLFMEIYFYNTIKMANQLLGYVFNGQYQLSKPMIDGDEFTIPVTGNIIPCDDVSSLSESQRSMVGVILSAVMLYQSSTKYNILRLDEVDESLDTDNRLGFSNLLMSLKSILNIEQIFFISHNQETSLDNTDIILLYDDPIIKEQFRKYNIIFEI